MEGRKEKHDDGFVQEDLENYPDGGNEILDMHHMPPETNEMRNGPGVLKDKTIWMQQTRRDGSRTETEVHYHPGDAGIHTKHRNCGCISCYNRELFDKIITQYF